MAEVRVGVLGAADVLGPMNGPSASKWDLSTPSTWAVIFFVGALLFLAVL